MDILELLSNVGVICPNCKSPMGTNGFFYKCPKCHTNLNAVKKDEIRDLIDYALNREKALQLLLDLSKREKWDGPYDKKLKKNESVNLRNIKEKLQGKLTGCQRKRILT